MNSRVATILERAIARGQKGDIDSSATLWTFAASTIFIVNNGEVAGGQFPTAPLLVEREGDQFLATYTHPDQISNLGGELKIVALPAFEVLKRLPRHAGIAINVGSLINLAVPAEVIHSFTEQLVNTKIPESPAAGE